MGVVTARAGATELDEIRSIFGLSETELARLFGVSRPAIARWRESGVPVERGADVDRVRELATYFHRRFLPVRIPQIVRTPGRGLNDQTVLDVLRAREVDRVYAYLEDLFSYTPA
jgi:transcriptional regulator with XRE-family HTH domain